MISVTHPIAVVYRFFMSFGVGYFCCLYMAAILTFVFHFYFARAEAIFLAAVLALIFYIFFVIIIFCTYSLKKISLYSLLPLAGLFILSRFTG